MKMGNQAAGGLAGVSAKRARLQNYKLQVTHLQIGETRGECGPARPQLAISHICWTTCQGTGWRGLLRVARQRSRVAER